MGRLKWRLPSIALGLALIVCAVSLSWANSIPNTQITSGVIRIASHDECRPGGPSLWRKKLAYLLKAGADDTFLGGAKFIIMLVVGFLFAVAWYDFLDRAGRKQKQ